MGTQSTSSLSYDDLLLEVARKMGVGYYGADGTEAVQIPVDTHDLAEVVRLVNAGLRMFQADAPPTGWRWARPTASIDLWADLTEDASRTIAFGAYDSDNDETPATANTSVFYETMEEKTITLHDGTTAVIKRYVSATSIMVYGDKHGLTDNQEYAIASGGDFTLPRDFAGTIDGILTFGPATNRAIHLQTVGEGEIRLWRENITVVTGVPRVAGLAVFQGTQAKRRHQLMFWPSPDRHYVVQTPYQRVIDAVTADDAGLAAVIPIPVALDEVVRASCLATVEREVDDTTDGPAMQHYQRQLQNAYVVDGRSAPRRLGYNGAGTRPGIGTIQEFRDFLEKRPPVSYGG